MRLTATCVAIVAGTASALHGGVELAAPFADGCVLQRDVPVAVWGTAEAGERVQVSFGNQVVATVASRDGYWAVHLAPMPACSEGRVLTANGVCVNDVLVGEVWLCAGQSNAEMPISGSSPRFLDKTGALVAAMTRKPLVRFLSMYGEPWCAEPRTRPVNHAEWHRFVPENLERDGSFSALGAYFALELHSALDVPVGIIGAYRGSTPIEAWIPPTAYENRPELKDYPAYPPVPSERWNPSMTNAFVRYGGYQQPCVMWNAMIAPLVPYTLKGVVWYQGCSNQWNADRYLELQHALYDCWVAAFERQGLPFRFVQVDAWEWKGGSAVPIQLSQARFASEEKNAAMAVISDIGNRWDAHPNGKAIVAKRLAALVLARDYGFSGLHADSPMLKEWLMDGREAVLTFENARSLYLYNPDNSLASRFELAGSDGKWIPAEFTNVETKGLRRGAFTANEIRLSAPGLTTPTAVRYLCSPPFVGNVFNEMGLPLGVFSTLASVRKDVIRK